MNVNTYDATPMYEEVINGRDPKPCNRVFREGNSFWRWFEVWPDGFLPATTNERWPDVLSYWDRTGRDPEELVSFNKLQEDIKVLVDVTKKHPRP